MVIQKILLVTMVVRTVPILDMAVVQAGMMEDSLLMVIPLVAVLVHLVVTVVEDTHPKAKCREISPPQSSANLNITLPRQESQHTFY